MANNLIISEKPIAILLIDDDESFLSTLERRIQSYFPNALIKTANTKKQADDLIKKVSTGFRITVCDIGLRLDQDKDREKNLGVKILEKLSQNDSFPFLFAITKKISENDEKKIDRLNIPLTLKDDGWPQLLDTIKQYYRD